MTQIYQLCYYANVLYWHLFGLILSLALIALQAQAMQQDMSKYTVPKSFVGVCHFLITRMQRCNLINTTTLIGSLFNHLGLVETLIFYHFLETEGGGELPHIPKFPNDIKRRQSQQSLEINPMFTILVIGSLPQKYRLLQKLH